MDLSILFCHFGNVQKQVITTERKLENDQKIAEIFFYDSYTRGSVK